MKRSRRPLVVLMLAIALAGAGCEREVRRLVPDPGSSVPAIEAGPTPDTSHYLGNAQAVSQGQQLYSYFNCNACHGEGGGSIGPPLMGAHWRYGGTIENIRTSIVFGRPNGMPGWGHRISDDESWELAAYVISLGGYLRSDVASNRTDHMQMRVPENTIQPANP